MTPGIPLLDLSRWTDGTREQRSALSGEFDEALQLWGFVMISGHGIAPAWKSELRSAASRFFALPAATRTPYATTVGGRGWIPPGKEANSFYGEAADPSRADLKESFVCGPAAGLGAAALDAQWFPPNVWPLEVPELARITLRYTEALDSLYQTLLEVCARALGLPAGWFAERNRCPLRTLNINRYPPLSATGPPLEGQFRIGAHTDWGTLTILDREPGYGGLEVQSVSGEWHSAPFVEDAFTVNVGDLLARWTGDRWRSTRHRVLPPSGLAPDEELMSLVGFFEGDPDVLVETFAPPVGRGNSYQPVIVGDYLRERASAATVH